VSNEGEPAPSKPPRSALTVRDMLVALAVLVPVILLFGALTRSCSFSPGGATVDSSRLPVVDAPAELRAAAETVPFPVRVPSVPPDWRANSVGKDRVAAPGTDPAAASRVVRVGYLTAADRYVRLEQTDATEDALVAAQAGDQPLTGRGTEEVAGLRWVVYGRGGDEPVWVAELPGPTPVRALITGSGTVEEFRTLAGAVGS
jgi:hypothetical protein